MLTDGLVLTVKIQFCLKKKKETNYVLIQTELGLVDLSVWMWICLESDVFTICWSNTILCLLLYAISGFSRYGTCMFTSKMFETIISKADSYFDKVITFRSHKS